MGAKVSLLKVLGTLDDCLSDSALIDRAPTDVVHNLRAGILRQGLAVLTFSAMETFIRERTGEVLRSFTNTSLTFADLSDELQSASTLGALEGVRFRLKLQAQQDKVAWLVGALAPIANAMMDITNLSDHSFGYASSNLVVDDVSKILKAFGVESPWIQMTGLTSRLGVSLLDCKSEFEAIMRRRHSSAHSIAGSIPHSDLQGSLRSVLAICITFDVLLSGARALINDGRSPGASGRPKLTSSGLNFIFVESRQNGREFVVRKEQLPPPAARLYRSTLRVFSDETVALEFGEQYANRHHGNMVVLGVAATPVNWITWA